MLDRRMFFQSAGAVIAALAGVPSSAVSPRAARPSVAAPDVALVDRNLDGSVSFAATAHVRGIALLEFSSDAGGIWMRELEPRLRAGSVAIEGLTSVATLFCLEVLARDYGARVVRRSDTPAGVIWTVSSSPIRRAPLAPPPSRRSAAHA
jgi:hypothetical protein